MPKEIIQDFFSHAFNRYLIVALVLLGIVAYSLPGMGDNLDNGNDQLIIRFFHMPGCPHCASEKVFLSALKEDYPDLKIIHHDITTSGEFEIYKSYFEAYEIGGGMGSVPMTLIGEDYMLGFDSANTTGKAIKNHIDDCLESGCPNPQDVLEDGPDVEPSSMQIRSNGNLEIDIPFFGAIDARGISLPFLAVILGLIDGFNPCAMWVLVYMIALLMELKDPRRMWLIVGIFLAASGILYFLFMTAWLNVFLFLGYLRIITVIVGCAALGFGIMNFKEYYDSKGAVVCKVGSMDDKASTAKRMKNVINAELTLFTLGSIIALAFAVNSIEFVCSSALPAVFSQVLAIAELSFLEHYGYILLYVLFFMLDDVVIFSMAAMALSKLSIGEKYVGVSKILGGLILVILGIVMLFFPGLLR